MTEIEKLQRAKMYIDKLANGISPIDDIAVADGDIINNVRISRCLFYVSEVLNKVMADGYRSDERGKKKQQFALTPEELNAFMFSDSAIPVSEIAKRLNALVESKPMTKLKYRSITDWLCSIELLITQTNTNGSSVKRPTAQGEELGISTEERFGQGGRYVVVLYNRDAQQFIIDNIEAIIDMNNQKKSKEKGAELQGQAWMTSHDECLIDLNEKGVPVSEIAVKLKQSETSIRERLKRLGIIENRNEAM